MVDSTHLAATVGHRTLDEFEVGFAQQVGKDAIFLTHGQWPASEQAPVGSRVRVEIRLVDGARAVAFEGVIGWRYPAAAVPPGREAGTGVIVTEVDAASSAFLERMRERPDAGTRVLVPGRTLSPSSELLPSQKATRSPMPRMLGLLSESSLRESDVGAAPVDSLPPRPVPPSFLDAPTLDGIDDGHPAQTITGLPRPSPSLNPADPFTIEQLPDAAPAGGGFEAHPTDVDLLGSVDADDVVELPDEGARRPPAPSEEADDADASETLISRRRPGASVSDQRDEWNIQEHTVIAAPPTLFGTLIPVDEKTADGSSASRPLPPPDGWPELPALPAGVVGVAFSVSPRRGQHGLEPFGWPVDGSKRAGSPDIGSDVLEPEPLFADAIEEDVAEPDVFSAPNTRGDQTGSGDAPVEEVFAADWPSTSPSVLLSPPDTLVQNAEPKRSDESEESEEGDTELDLRRPQHRDR